MPRIPEDIDRSLWFLHRGCSGRHYLLGNPHTVAGRLWAWCPKNDCSFFLSRKDIDTLSQAARYWVAGYLHGCEPPPPLDEDGMPDLSSQRYRDYLRRAARFRRTGMWPAARPARGRRSAP